MYTSWYTWKRHEHKTSLMGKNQKDTAVFWGETGPDGTTAFKGGTLKFYGASAVNENRVLVVKGGPTKRYLECTGGVGTGQAKCPPPPLHHPPTSLFRDGPHGAIHKQQPVAAP